MEKVDLNFLRKQWKEELKYYWEPLQKEINDYFEMIKVTNRWEAQKKLTKSKQEVLEDFSLTEEKIKDPLFIPDILPLLEEIKENNFNLFTRDWISGHYNHYNHAFNIKNTIIPALIPVADKIVKFKVIQYNNLYDNPKDYDKLESVSPKKKFITRDFQKYGLVQYDHYLDLINNIANHDKFFVILPNLLRTLFENILHDIFKTSLNDKHRTLYFDKHKGRVADFSVLINLLNKLSQFVYKNEIRENVTEQIIKTLKDIRKIGNLSIHEVIRKVKRSYADEIQDEIDLALEALLVSYHQLKNASVIIELDIITKIVDKIDVKTAKEIKKGKEQKSQTHDLSKHELRKYDYLVRLIYLLQKYDAIKDYEREEIETTMELCRLSTQLNLIKFKVKEMLQLEGFPLETRVYDKNYEFFFEPTELPNRFVIRIIGEKKSYFSKDHEEYEKVESKLEVLNGFIKYLIDRMENLSLYSLLEEVEINERVLKKYIRLRKFIEYIYSDDYLNKNSKDIRYDERVKSELNWIEQNEPELNDLFTVFRRKDESGKYNKIISLLNGKYLLHFRSHASFNSSIQTKEEAVESSNSQKIKALLFMLFEEIKSHIKDNSGITI